MRGASNRRGSLRDGRPAMEGCSVISSSLGFANAMVRACARTSMGQFSPAAQILHIVSFVQQGPL